jgi:hypothetical protein
MPELAVQILGILAPLLVTGVTWVVGQLALLIRAKTGSVVAGDAADRLSQMIVTIVTELEQTTVATLKARAPGGKLGQADYDALRKAALDKLKSYLGPAGMELIAKALGVDPTKFETFLVSKIESAVYAVNAGATPTMGGAVGNTASGGGDTLPPFFASSPSHPAQQGLGGITPGVLPGQIPGANPATPR